MSISRNPKNNRWYVLVDVPAGADGKRRRRGVGGFKTKREAKAAEAEALRRIRDGVFVEPSKLMLGAYLTKMWLPYMVSQVRATTLGGYRHNVRAYIVPRLGDIPLQRLTTARVGAFYGELVASGGQHGRPLSPKDGPLRPHHAPPCASGCRGRRPGGPQRCRPGQAAPGSPGRDAHLDSRAGRNLPRGGPGGSAVPRLAAAGHAGNAPR
jgi:Arm DNA-binding domain/Phage integrase, N-terminal SAM-like domain